MPELPEVETITRELAKSLIGKKISRFFVFDKEKIKTPRLDYPLKIVSLRRRGKYIVCETSGGLSCTMHLRMTGELLLEARNKKKEPQKKEKHERARFHFHDGSALRFVDVRRFGTINWTKKGVVLPQLGPEPLSRDFNARVLADILKRSSRSVKSFLLDQHLIAGIGNIYADESLWLAKINPERKADNLKTREIGRLAVAIKKILRKAIKKGGSTLRDYRRTDGSSGYYQKSRKVYDREGLPCFRCRAKIKRIKIGGRSSYFCPKCQK